MSGHFANLEPVVVEIACRVAAELGHPLGWVPKPLVYEPQEDALSYGFVGVLSLRDEIDFGVWLDYGKEHGAKDTPLLAAAFSAAGDVGAELQSLAAQSNAGVNQYARGSKARLRGFDEKVVFERDRFGVVSLSRYRAAGQYDTPAAVKAFVKLFHDWHGKVEFASSEPPEIAEEVAALEGRERTRLVRHRSRERWKRQEKVEAFKKEHAGRLFCEVPNCGFDFEIAYGVEYAHVHHKRDLASSAGPSATKLEDLAIVCPNCHAFIHQGGGTKKWSDRARWIRRAAERRA